MRFCFPSDLVGATATITSTNAADADYPLSNLHDGRPTEPTRWTTAASTRIVWDLGAGSPTTRVEGLIIVMHTMPAGSVLKVQANAADAWGAPTFSQDVTVPAWGPELVLSLPANILVDLRGTTLATTGYRFLSLLLPDHGSPGADHALGEVCWIGAWQSPASSAAWPVRRGEVRRVSVNSTSYGVDHVIDRHVRQRRLFPRLGAIGDADRALWLQLAREAGGDVGFPLVLDVDETSDFAASAEGLFVRFHPESINALQEDLIVFGASDLQLDLLEVQRGLPLV